MLGPAHTSHSAAVTLARLALGLLAALVFLGGILVVIGAASLAVSYPEFAHLRLPFVIATIAFGACVEVALILTAVLVGCVRDRRILEPATLRLVDCLITVIAVASVIVAGVLSMTPGPPALALLLFSGAVAGTACALVLLAFRSALRGTAVMREKLDEVA